VLLSLLHQESRFNPNAVSRAGALGMGQLMPGTARELGVDPLNPMQNIEGSARYLRQQLDRFGGDMTLALAAYNAGARRVAEAGNTIPNNKETQAYVPTVMRNAGMPGYAMGGLAELERKYSKGGLNISDEEYDRRLRARLNQDARRTFRGMRQIEYLDGPAVGQMTRNNPIPIVVESNDGPGAGQMTRSGPVTVTVETRDGPGAGQMTRNNPLPIVVESHDGPGSGQMMRSRPAPRPAPREELTADQLNGMVLDRLAARYDVAPESAVAAEARDRIGRAMGYAEGGLANLHQKYEGGGIVRRVARRALRSTAPEEIAENPRAVMGNNNPPRSVLKSTMTPDEAMAIATRPQPGAGVPRLEGEDLERANELSQRVLDFRAAQMRLPPKARVQPRPEDQLFPAARFDQPLEAGPSNVAQELEALRIGNIAPDQALPGSRAAAGVASDLAERYGPTMDRIVGDLDPIARIMRGEEVPGATPAQIASARAGEFYNMRPIYDVLRQQGVSHEEALRRIRQEAQAIAGTSPRTDTEQNVLNSAFLQNRMARGLPVDAASVQASTGPGSGYGMIYDQHPALTEGLLEGTISLAQNPKPTVFGRNISGDRSAVTADVHNVRAVNMLFNDLHPGELPASSFDSAAKYQRYLDAYTPDADGVVRGMNDAELRKILVARPSGQGVRGQDVSTEYPIYNDITTNIAGRLGLTPADAQALMWFHYGPRTGLASEAHTVPELLNQRMSITSQALGIPPEEVLRLYSRNMIPLAGVAPAAILAREGEPAPSLEELDQRYAEGGPVMSDEEYDRRLLERMKRDTGRTTESTNAEQARALRSAGYDAAQLASDIFLPQSPMDAALMMAFGPGGRMARLAGSTALMAMEPSEAEAIISPRTARSIRMATRLPQDVRFRQAVEATPGASITDDGLSLEVLRHQKPEQAGEQAIREGVFYLPATLPSRSVGTYRGTSASTYGGPDLVRGETLLRAPLAMPGNTGGVVPERAFRELTSDANMRRLERESRSAATAPLLGAEYRENIENFLNQWGGNPNVAHELVSNSRGGNRMRYALQEHVIGNRARQEGYDSIVGTGARTPRITEVFDLREAAYPVPGHPEFEMLLPRFEDNRYAHGGLAQLHHKYSEGGAVSAQPAIYDPDAVNALANQIEAGYV
jgi:hypothetical protein